jgi:NAD(P)-dependent dehydrogenase (short-subunit alcohol dehydrogenase family)
MFNLSGKVALVTGARRGMGKAHALALAKQGATVVITDIDLTECQVVADEVVQAGGVAACFALDVSDKAQVEQVVADVERQFGHLDILVNNAGIYQSKPVLDITEDEWNRMIAIDLSGSFWCAQAAARAMAKNGWGRIINIASISSGGVGIGVPQSVHYTAAKGGIIGMTEAMAVDLADKGILVNAIAPGSIDTPMANPEGKPREQLSALVPRAALKRIGTPEEVSSAVVFLASDEASYITGTTLYVDGGWLAS